MQSRALCRISGRRRIWMGLWRLLLVLTVFLLISDLLFGRAIRRTTIMQGNILASKALSESVLSVIEKSDLSYDKLCRVSYDENGKITSLVYDTVELNRLLSVLELTVTDALSGKQNTVSLPLGTLMGIELLSGRGPNIPLRISALGYVQAACSSEFSSAGVNQTRHRIVVTMTATVNVYVPFYADNFTVTREFFIAETILVGEVPNALLGSYPIAN